MMQARSGLHPRSILLYKLNDPLGLPLVTRLISLSAAPKIYKILDDPDAQYIVIDLAARVLLEEYCGKNATPKFIELPIPTFETAEVAGAKEAKDGIEKRD